jgi:hypothetical protein
LPGDNGDDHNDGAHAERSDCKEEVLRHGETAPRANMTCVTYP